MKHVFNPDIYELHFFACRFFNLLTGNNNSANRGINDIDELHAPFKSKNLFNSFFDNSD